MSNEKTALELVDELREYAIKELWPSHENFIRQLAFRIKAAIERERDAMMADIQRLQVAIGQNQAEFDRTIQDMNDRLKSAITMRPIAELPDRVPDGCVIVIVSSHTALDFFENGAVFVAAFVKRDGRFYDAKGFYILPLPKPARKLHACYMPGCGGSVTAINGVEKTDWRMMCTKCGMLGPIFNTKAKAELEWGHEE